MQSLLSSRMVVGMTGTTGGGTTVGPVYVTGMNATDIWNYFDHKLKSKGVRLG